MGRPGPQPIQDHALENLKYIRSAMERAGSFTAVPGAGGMAMGATALAAAWLARRQTDPQAWLAVWLTEMVLALAIGSLAMVHKSKRSGAPLWNEAARKFALCFTPPILAGAILTWPLYHAGLPHLIAACWLLLYGVAVIAGGSYSVSVVPAMGVAFFALGLVALVTPPALKDLPLAAGFGGLNLVFGFWIYRRYGG